MDPKPYPLIAQLIGCAYNCNQLVADIPQGTMKRDIFQAIADPTRRAIIALIASQAMTPNAIADHFDISRQATSKHIRILDECGLVQTEKTGREIYYQLRLEKMHEIDVWLEQFRKLWEDRYEQLDDLLTNLKGAKK
jgi:DNA-binding transcriptional ArsR family regulator